MPKTRRTSGALKTKYGLAPRRQYMEVMGLVKATYPCTRCGFKSVKRFSVGVWKCRKCGYTFTGGAYQPFTKTGETAARASRSVSTASATTQERLKTEAAEKA